jgi:cobalt-precorrin 5A hydrolase
MEHYPMIIAGFGFRASTTAATLCALLGKAQVDGVAVAADKSHHPALLGLMQGCGKPLFVIALRELAYDRAQTPAPHQPERYGIMSLAESVALAAAGPTATLIQPRIIAADGTATMALAQGPET